MNTPHLSDRGCLLCLLDSLEHHYRFDISETSLFSMSVMAGDPPVTPETYRVKSKHMIFFFFLGFLSFHSLDPISSFSCISCWCSFPWAICSSDTNFLSFCFKTWIRMCINRFPVCVILMPTVAAIASWEVVKAMVTTLRCRNHVPFLSPRPLSFVFFPHLLSSILTAFQALLRSLVPLKAS